MRFRKVINLLWEQSGLNLGMLSDQVSLSMLKSHRTHTLSQVLPHLADKDLEFLETLQVILPGQVVGSDEEWSVSHNF